MLNQSRPNDKVGFVCQSDRVALALAPCGYICPKCKRTYAYQNGVFCGLDKTDDFYEGAYENKVYYLPRSERIWHVWPVWLINSGYLWAVREYIPAGSRVLELGCAGGVRYFGHRYNMIGCDLSYASLEKTEFYSGLLQADATKCIPLADASVDAVVSSYFWEHIHPADKKKVLSEIRRILKPGGRIVFLYDVETENPLINYCRNKDKALYERMFIAGDGHKGYQPPLQNLGLFVDGGFKILAHRGLEKTFLQSPPAYVKLEKFETIFKTIFSLGARIGSSSIFYPYTALMRIVDCSVCRILPQSWARMDLIVGEYYP